MVYRWYIKRKTRGIPMDKNDLYKELVRTKSQIKNITVVCTGDIEATFNFDSDEWVDNSVNYKEDLDKANSEREEVNVFSTDLEEYNYKVKLIDKKRRKAYTKKTDPLLNEARIKRLLGEDEEADTLEIEALTLRENIQIEFVKFSLHGDFSN